MPASTRKAPDLRPPSGHDRVMVLVKAIPHAGARQGETVCCAGVTANGEWRRQYPVPFRRLTETFGRWDWIEYDWISPKARDTRLESRRVQEDTLKVDGKMPQSERARFLNPLILPSMEIATALGRSLVLIRPRKTRFRYKAKTADQIAAEKRKYQAASDQLSLMDKELAALDPCPYSFKFEFETDDGVKHAMTCEDWETAATFYRYQRSLGGANAALARMDAVFNDEYPVAGMAFAMGTHSRHPDQWLLVGVLRLDVVLQGSLGL